MTETKRAVGSRPAGRSVRGRTAPPLLGAVPGDGSTAPRGVLRRYRLLAGVALFFAPLRPAFRAVFLPFFAPERFAAVLRAGARFFADLRPFFALRFFAAFLAGDFATALRFVVFLRFVALRAGFFGPGIVAPPK